MRIALVTGGTGFVGSHLVRRLVREGFEVHLLCRQSSDFWRLQDTLPDVHRHLGALEQLAPLQAIVKAVQPSHIFHLASATMVAGAAPQASELTAVNLLGTVNLIEACDAVNYRALVVTGDSFEYSASHEKLREAAACHPDNLHGITKLAATLYAQAVARTRERPIVGLRLFSTYGPKDNPRRLVMRLFAHALAGTAVPLSRPEISRDWVYIDDVVELYLEAAKNAARLAGQVFNAGSGHAATIAELVEKILHLTGSRAAAHWGKFQAPPHDDFPWTADMSQTFEHFAWRPRTTLTEGLAATLADLLASAAHAVPAANG